MAILSAKPISIEIDVREPAAIFVGMQNASDSQVGMFDPAGPDISGAAQVIEVTLDWWILVDDAMNRAGLDPNHRVVHQFETPLAG